MTGLGLLYFIVSSTFGSTFHSGFTESRFLSGLHRAPGLESSAVLLPRVSESRFSFHIGFFLNLSANWGPVPTARYAVYNTCYGLWNSRSGRADLLIRHLNSHGIPGLMLHESWSSHHGQNKPVNSSPNTQVSGHRMISVGRLCPVVIPPCQIITISTIGNLPKIKEISCLPAYRDHFNATPR